MTKINELVTDISVAERLYHFMFLSSYDKSPETYLRYLSGRKKEFRADLLSQLQLDTNKDNFYDSREIKLKLNALLEDLKYSLRHKETVRLLEFFIQLEQLQINKYLFIINNCPIHLNDCLGQQLNETIFHLSELNDLKDEYGLDDRI